MQFPCIPPHTHTQIVHTHTHTLWKKSNYSIADVQDIQLHFDPYSIPFCCSVGRCDALHKNRTTTTTATRTATTAVGKTWLTPPLHHQPLCPTPFSPLALLLASKSFSCMAFARASLDLVCCLVRKPSEKGREGERERERERGRSGTLQLRMISSRSGRGCIPALALSMALARRRHRKQFSLPTFQGI